MPEILAYPNIDGVSDHQDIVGIFCYVVKAYKPGIAIVIKLDGDKAATMIGDWSGKIIASGPLFDKGMDFLKQYNISMARIMYQIGLPQAEFYISDDGKLVDVQVLANKFLGPGMLRDVFGKVMPTQDIIEISVVSADKIEQLKKLGKYVLKPSRFRTFKRKDELVPLYACI